MQDNKFLTSAAMQQTIATCEVRFAEALTPARSPTHRVQHTSAPELEINDDGTVVAARCAACSRRSD